MAISKKRLAEIESIKDEDIDCSDIPELDDTFWAHAELRLPKPKKGVYLRVDQDILSVSRQMALAIRPGLTRY